MVYQQELVLTAWRKCTPWAGHAHTTGTQAHYAYGSLGPSECFCCGFDYMDFFFRLKVGNIQIKNPDPRLREKFVKRFSLHTNTSNRAITPLLNSLMWPAHF